MSRITQAEDQGKVADLLESIDNCPTRNSTPTSRGLSAGSMDPADKPRDVGEGGSDLSPADPQGIVFTSAAAEKVASLVAEENNPKLNLRVAIHGGGCSGFQYAFSFDEEIHEDDAVIVQHCADGQSVRLLIDYISYQYLNNAEIDYINSIQGEQFIIRNPNAKTTCGCGSSFSMADDEEDEG